MCIHFRRTLTLLPPKMDSQISVKEYFSGKNIFITGASGFIGKALIEKLLRSCSDIKKMYVLLRPKKGMTLEERLEQISKSPIFERLKDMNPQFAKKLIPINGDVCKTGLGISEIDRELLKNEVNIFFNIAASVKFDDMLKDSIYSNLRSARESAMLALEMKKIEVFLHVSTTYCNIDNRKFVEEVLYPPQADWREAIMVAEKCNPIILDILSEKCKGDFPNTYTYTKRLAEHCVNDLLVGKVRTIICRPSVVLATLYEPFEGWLDNFNGPVGLMTAAGIGLLRIVYADSKVNGDINAVDNVVKSLIVAAWHKFNFGDPNHLSIYHSSNNGVAQYNIGRVIEFGKTICWQVPLEKRIWHPGPRATTCWYEFYLKVLILHVVPAIFLDFAIRIAGHKPILFKIQRKIYIANTAVGYFMLNDWTFDNKNLHSLFNALPVEERRDFNFMVMPTSDLVIENYYLAAANHLRVNLMNESRTISMSNKTRTKRMYYLDRILKILFYLTALWLFFVKINMPRKICSAAYTYWDSL